MNLHNAKIILVFFLILASLTILGCAQTSSGKTALPAQFAACTPSALKCGDGSYATWVYECVSDGSGWLSVTSCGYGCVNGVCNSSPSGVLSVSPNAGFSSSGAQGGSFFPSSIQYTLTNTGAATINWSASKSQSWVSLSSTSGTLVPGASTIVVVSLNSQANSLSAGSYSDTVSFANLTNGVGNLLVSVVLTVRSSGLGVLSVSPVSGFSSSGVVGGSFSPSSIQYTLTNTGNANVNWSASKSQSWVSLSSSSGALAPGASVVVTVSLNSNANSLSAGSYSGTVSFVNVTNGVGNLLVSVVLTVNSSVPAPGVLSVSPNAGFSSSGVQGGPFSPSSMQYTLKNTGGSSINWSAAKNRSWVSLSSSSGALAPGASVVVTVSLNSGVNSLPGGSYSDTVTFANLTNGSGGLSIGVSLVVSASATQVCSPSALKCGSGVDVNRVYRCASDGSAWSSLELCQYGCVNGVCNSAPSQVCSSGALKCLNSWVYECVSSSVGNSWQSVRYCNYGCLNGVCNSAPVTSGVLSVSAVGGYSFSGVVGGPFSPSSLSFSLSNTGAAAINWSASKSQSWVSLSKTSGTLAAGASDAVVVSLASAANSLSAGSHYDTISFANTTNHLGDAGVGISVVVSSPSLVCSPNALKCGSGVDVNRVFRCASDGSAWSSVELCQYGCVNGVCNSAPSGPVVRVCTPWDLKCGSGTEADWLLECASDGSGWRSVRACRYGCVNGVCNSQLCSPGALTCNDANWVMQCVSSNVGNNWQALKYCRYGCLNGDCISTFGVLSVSPSAGFSSTGVQGGPFSPSSIQYTLSNPSISSIAWTVSKSQSWVSLSSSSGSLAPGASTVVSVSLTSQAIYLGVGSYSDTVSFVNTTNTTNSSGNTTRSVSLVVSASPTRVCIPNSLKCGSLVDDVNYVYKCAADGSAWHSVESCFHGCVNGVCKRCIPGALTCSGKWVYQCKSDGTNSVPLKYCDYICLNGGCKMCTLGTQKCGAGGDINGLYRCASDGTSWSLVEHCQYGCGTSAGHDCKVCRRGLTKCENNKLYACKFNETGWDSPLICPVGCADGICKICTPGEKRCFGPETPSFATPIYYIHVCSSDGTKWNISTPCPAGCSRDSSPSRACNPQVCKDIKPGLFGNCRTKCANAGLQCEPSECSYGFWAMLFSNSSCHCCNGF